MLGYGEDSIKGGDILAVANVPQNGFFCLAQVSGDYYFHKLPLQAEQQVWGIPEDYGHVLPVKLLTPEGVNKYAEGVHADMRRTLNARNRLWNLDRYGPHVESIRNALAGGGRLVEPQAGSKRLQAAWETTVFQSRLALEKELEPALTASFRAAEWEEPIVNALRRLYPAPVAEVDWVGGSGEQGADVVVRIKDHFVDAAWQILIQVKDHTGEIADTRALGQLERAYAHYGKRAPIVRAIVMTTASRAAENFVEELKRVEQRLGIPVTLITRASLIKLMADGLLGDARGEPRAQSVQE
jgi:hypothetical protein